MLNYFCLFDRFPQVFEILSSPSSKEMYKASDVFPEVDQYVFLYFLVCT